MDYTQPSHIKTECIERIIEKISTGRLFRYQFEKHKNFSEVSFLEREFSRYTDSNFSLGINSGGQSLFIALKAFNIQASEYVYVNAFTLTPVPSSIIHAGGIPILIEIKEDLTIRTNYLFQVHFSFNSRFLMLSHMRGHVSDLDVILRFCKNESIFLIEDCAHTLGAIWKKTYKVGTYGHVNCFSCQTNKCINSGDSGIISTNDERILSKLILYSGSYGHFYQHLNRSSDNVFVCIHDFIPNFSVRMTEVNAILILYQLKFLDLKVKLINENFSFIINKIQKSIKGKIVKIRNHKMPINSSIL